MQGIEIIPTVVPLSFADIEAAAQKYAGFAHILHVDFADGIFAPNTTWMPEVNSEFTAMPWEAHLMVAQPREIGLSCIAAGASRVIGHIEATGAETSNILQAWKQAGASQAGLALLSQTPIESFDPFVSECDFAMLMTIERIGVQGLPFYSGAPERVASLHARHPDLAIEVDGSVNESTIVQLAPAGATRFCAGSVLSKAVDPASTYRTLVSLAGGVE
jgi:ribulose-phosphate 3-epimerase